MLTIFATLIIFGMMITVHEAGHFIIARKCGVVVEEFSIGMGPLLKRWEGKKDKTIYSIRLLPIGGFCKMLGEDSDEYIEGSLNSISPIKRIAVLAAGAMMNLISAFIILCFVFSIVGTNPTTTIKTLVSNSPAYISGLKEGDKIVKIGEKDIVSWEDINMAINEIKDKEVLVIAEDKNGNEKTLYITPEYSEENKKYMIGISPTYSKNISDIISISFKTFFDYIKITFTSVIDLIRGNVGVDQLSGPIGVATIIGEYISYGLATILNIASMLSISIGIFNLLPIPALDGSRILFCIIELIKGSPVNPEYEGKIHMIGFMALMALTLFIAYQDILRLF